MNIEEIVKKAVSEILLGGKSEESPATTNHPLIGHDVIVRCRLAGVHYGKLESVDGFVVLSDSHRIWSWSGAFTLSEVSTSGVSDGRVSCSVSTMTIPLQDVGEILPLTGSARAKLDTHIEGK